MNKPVDQSTRRFLVTMTAGVAALAAGCAMRDPSKPPEEGFEYRALDQPLPNLTGKKFEVVEFFWYGCPFCNVFEPVLRRWLEKQPPDVALRRVHVGLNPHHTNHQKLFFTLEVLGKSEELNGVVFSALHDRQMFLETPNQMADFIAAQGVDRKLFLDTMNSPEVKARIEKANAIAKAAKVDGVPMFAVDGKWMTDTAMAGDRDGALRVIDYLIARDRAGG